LRSTAVVRTTADAAFPFLNFDYKVLVDHLVLLLRQETNVHRELLVLGAAAWLAAALPFLSVLYNLLVVGTATHHPGGVFRDFYLSLLRARW